MSDMLERFNTSDKPHVKAARELLAHPVNFIDQTNQIQNEFSVNRGERLGQRGNDTALTDFTDKALNHYVDELKTGTTSKMDTYVPVEPGVPLNRWNPVQGYLDKHLGDPGAVGAKPR